MKTNEPSVIAWAPSLELAKLSLNGGPRNGVGCILTDGPTPHGNDAAMVRLSDYKALQAECEKLVEALEFIAKSVHPQGNGPGVVIRNVDGRDWRNWLETAEQLLAAHRKGGRP